MLRCGGMDVSPAFSHDNKVCDELQLHALAAQMMLKSAAASSNTCMVNGLLGLFLLGQGVRGRRRCTGQGAKQVVRADAVRKTPHTSKRLGTFFASRVAGLTHLFSLLLGHKIA